MKYRVIGANKETGEDVDVVLDAVDEAAAERIANRKGILVSSTSAVPQPGGLPAPKAAAPARARPAPRAVEKPVLLDETAEVGAAPPAYDQTAPPETPIAAGWPEPPPLPQAAQAPAWEPAAPPQWPAAQPQAPAQWPAAAPAGQWPQAAPQAAWPTVAPPAGMPTLAPMPAGRPPKASTLPPVLKKWGIPAGGALAGIIALVLLYVFVFRGMFGGGMGSYERYLPNNAAMVMLIDLDAARKNDSSGGGAPKPFEFSKVTAADSELVQMCMAHGDEGDMTLVRTRSGKDLDYFAPQLTNRKTYNGVEYCKPTAASGSTLLAKVDKKTFIRIGGPRAEEYIKRIADGKEPSLSADFKGGLSKAKGDFCMVTTGGGPMGGPAVKAMWMSINMVSKDSGKADIGMVFGNEADASKAATEMNKNRATIESMAKSGAGKGGKVTLSTANSSGSTVTFSMDIQAPAGAGGKFDMKSFLPF